MPSTSLSRNNAVKKETRAKEQTAFYKNAMPQRTAPQVARAAQAATMRLRRCSSTATTASAKMIARCARRLISRS